MRAWLADVTARDGWMGGLASWFGSSMLESSPFNTALTELAENIRAGRTEHPCDARFGRDVGHVVAEAQRQILARRPG